LERRSRNRINSFYVDWIASQPLDRHNHRVRGHHRWPLLLEGIGVTVTEAFTTYKSRLEITSTEAKDASRRQKDVRARIQTEFDVSTDFLTGSYARHTKTKPLKDVDIFVVLGPGEAYRKKEVPARMLSAVAACLTKEYGDGRVRPDRRCVTVTFDKPNPTAQEDAKVLSVDVVPAFETGKHYAIPDARLNAWISTNPEVHAEMATSKNTELDSNWVPLEKMIKGWNRNVGEPIKPSFLIEVMALGLVDAPFNSFPDEIRRFFAAASSSIATTWPDPAGLGPNVSDEMSAAACTVAATALRNAEMLATTAHRAEQRGRNGEALSIWREIFGRYFPTS
jgi:hypothetical protein